MRIRHTKPDTQDDVTEQQLTSFEGQEPDRKWLPYGAEVIVAPNDFAVYLCGKMPNIN